MFTLIPLLLVLPGDSATVGGARMIEFHGYQSAIELTNEVGIRVVLCPEVGGRVLEYSLDGRNALYLSDAEKAWTPGKRPQASAGRFDIGPELIIPRRDVLWSGKWSGAIVGDGHVRMTSQNDLATGVRLVRDFVLAKNSSRLSCSQTIENISDAHKEWCHWSRTFAVGNGVCVIPLTEPSRFPNHYVLYEEGALINMRPEDASIHAIDGNLVVSRHPRKPKLGFDSAAGVIAYMAPNDLLFVKRFEVDRNRVYNEAAAITISVWYPEGEMVELEPIGPREMLAPGESATFTEEWWLSGMEFPADVDSPDMVALKAALSELDD